MCTRDDEEIFVLGTTLWFTPLCSTKALGLLHAINWIHDLHLQLENVDFELEAKKVANHFNKSTNDIIEFEVMIHECKNVVVICFF
jgi:hypothetical protein